MNFTSLINTSNVQQNTQPIDKRETQKNSSYAELSAQNQDTASDSEVQSQQQRFEQVLKLIVPLLIQLLEKLLSENLPDPEDNRKKTLNLLNPLPTDQIG